MDDKVTELFLGRSYTFNVVYREEGLGFAGVLNLTPEKITFKVMTEMSGGRECKLDWRTTEAVCDDNFNNKFILKGMFCEYSRSSTLSHNPNVGFYEVEFSVESVIMCPRHRPRDGKFAVIQVYSETVNSWVGHTVTQEKILQCHHDASDMSEHLTEFEVVANGVELIGVQYNAAFDHSLLSYQQSFKFPPSLFYTLDDENSLNPIATYFKIYNLLSLLTGSNPSVQQVCLEYELYESVQRAFLYFVNDSWKPRASRDFTMFPLGKDPRYETWGLKPFPLSSFELYFDRKSELPDIVEKYVKYRSMANVEDQLLGYFRLLEKHCYNEKSYISSDLLVSLSKEVRVHLKANGLARKQILDFEKGLKRFNGSKYNTEKCVTDFYLSLPEVIRKELNVSQDVIGIICKLRNDITHANKYHLAQEKIHRYTALIHHLLIFALLERLGVPLDDVGALTSRLRN